MKACGCGSEEFEVQFRTVARLILTAGEPTTVIYGPIHDPEPFSTVMCRRCGAHLDIDNLITPGVDPGPLLAARKEGNRYAGGLPEVTVRARKSYLSVPVSEALRRHREQEE